MNHTGASCKGSAQHVGNMSDGLCSDTLEIEKKKKNKPREMCTQCQTLSLASDVVMVLAPLTQMTDHSKDYFGIKKFSLRESTNINTYNT